MVLAARARPDAPRALLLAALVIVAACGRTAAPSFPTGAGTPFPEFASAYAEASATCRTIKALTVSLALSGNAGRTRLRGRVDAGFAVPSQMRLEGRAPFGRPVFVLTADRDLAVLTLPRDRRVLTGASAAEIVEALAGVALDADALRVIVSGCGITLADAPADGRSYASGWAAVTVGNGVSYLRRSGSAWQIVGATRDTLSIFYSDFQNGRPTTVNLRAAASGATADIAFHLSQIDVNPTLDPQTFQQENPADAMPLTLDELRRAGPLGETGTGEAR